jgi:hypothetical protein
LSRRFCRFYGKKEPDGAPTFRLLLFCPWATAQSLLAGLGHRAILSGRLLKQVRWIIPLTVTTARSGAVLLQAANAKESSRHTRACSESLN